jgi:hypothetical protein
MPRVYLKKGNIYSCRDRFYSGEVLFIIEKATKNLISCHLLASSGFDYSNDEPDELKAFHRPWLYKFKRVQAQDLPLYINLPYKYDRFTRLLKKGI